MDSNIPVEDAEPAPGFRFVYMMSGTQTTAGSSDNTCTYYVLNSEGIDVTENFDISCAYGVLTVTPIEITCESDNIIEFYTESKIACGEENCRKISGELVSGHSIKFIPTASSVDVCEMENRFYAVITDENGVDVTHNYHITYMYGTFKVMPHTIKVITPGATHTYDGTPFSCHEYTIDPLESLLDGHQISYISFSPNTILTDVGTVKNTIANIIIKNSEGKDVTRNYRIDNSDQGYITVTPRPIVIRTPDAAKYCDGTPLTDERWEIVSVTQPIESHRLEVSVSGTITEIGRTDNIIAEVRISDVYTGENMTYNYAITKQLGTLIVKGTTSGGSDSGDGVGGIGGDAGSGSGGMLDESGGIGGEGSESENNAVSLRLYSEKTGPVYLRMKSFGDFDPDAKGWTEATEYDRLLDGKYSYNYLSGIALRNTGFSSVRIDIENLMYGQYFIPYFPDTYDANYDIQTSDVLYTGDVSEVYSLYYYLYSGYFTGINASLGEYSDEELAYRDFVHANYLYVDPQLKTYMDDIIEFNGFNPSSTSIISDVATYIQNAATYNLQYNPAIDSAVHPIIAFLTAREGVCRHYASAATALYRSLGIPARYTIGFVGNTKAEEWTEVKANQAHAWVEVYIDGIGWLPIEVTGSSSDGSEGSGAGGIGGMEGSGGGLGGSSGNGSGGSGSGSGGSGSGAGGSGSGSGGSGGSLDNENSNATTIRPRTTYHKYDGNLAYPENLVDGLTKLTSQGFTYSVTVDKVGEATNLPGIYETRITSFTLYDKNGNDVTEDYTINFSVGYLQIYVQEITVRTFGGTKEYDGAPLTSDKYSIDGSLLSGHTLKSLVCTGRQTNVGRSTNNFNVSIADASGKDVTDHYKINRICASLTVTHKIVTVTANSATKSYDGTALIDTGFTIDGNVDGYTVSVTVSGSQTNIGYSDNVVQRVAIKDKSGVDVTSNFSIDCINGKLYVTPPTN